MRAPSSFIAPLPHLSLGLTLLLTAWSSQAAGVPAADAPAAAPVTWQQCSATTDNQDRLACFDSWSKQQQPLTAPPASNWTAPAASANAQPTAALAAVDQGITPTNGGCRDDRYSEISRFYELEPGTDCGTFSFRGYRPLSVSVTAADSVNKQPTSPGKPAATYEDYDTSEMRIQLSARTKIASGLLTGPTSKGKDSVWVAYSQQSYWQVFNPGLSRPFRTTDHEPEIFYIYPTDAQLPFGWRWRYTGAGLVHQSNGQSEPLSRSWNRWYASTGLELDRRWQLHAKFWQRISESADKDDNPRIQDYIGRGEVKLVWNLDQANTLGLTARGSIGKGYGSGRLEWMRALGEGWNGGKSNLRLHMQLFSGYGDTLIDYNRKRTAFSVGFSLLDF